MLSDLGVGILYEELGVESEFDTQRTDLLQRELKEMEMPHHMKTTVAAGTIEDASLISLILYKYEHIFKMLYIFYIAHTNKSSMRSGNLLNIQNDYSMLNDVTHNLLSSNMCTL
ncbi:hypothetical protein POWCR01_000145300 [Plasmodium ovale]|uniref:PIR protein n=1 Tax=Plasmodium ovale TaxID=36330 RepID=A0A1C3KJ58_PLAOA|nr:hypothetical protein POWCR01_000145300 [Plasmodium ovale]